ncbi:MAG TPA: GGDEF domain-containing protein [Verrucomicrobiae bacterium]|nr:GGDEF domain-containing protein [Verrucomicrobiae bacterium]
MTHPRTWGAAVGCGPDRGGARALVLGYAATVLVAAVSSSLGLPAGASRAVVELGVAGVCLALAARWASGGDPATQRFWRWAATGMACLGGWYLTGAQLDAALGPHLVILPQALLVGTFACLAAAMGIRVIGVAGRNRGVATLVDAAILGISAMALGAPVLLGPVLGGGTRVAVAAVSWVADLVLLAEVQWARAHQPATRDPRGLGRVSAMLVGAALLALAQALLERHGRILPPYWFVALSGGVFLIGLDARRLDALRPPGTGRVRRPRRAALLIGPYGPAAVVTALALAAVAAGDHSGQARVIVTGAILIGACFGLRQFFLLRDHEDLLAARSVEALHDGLTGLRNRRAFDRDLARLQASAEGGHGFALVLADVDDLKLINDGSGGHRAGDHALRAVASALAGAVRAGDGAYRLGGDEFALLMPGGTARTAARAAAATRAALVAGGAACAISFGVAAAPADGSGARILFDAADQALYRAKRGASLGAVG